MENANAVARNPSTELLSGEEPGPFGALNEGAASPFLLIGDHAGELVPLKLNALGLPPEAFLRHIALDIGVAGLGERVAGLLGAEFLRQRYSRLVIDCNRSPDAEDAIPQVSDGVEIPGNAALTDEAREARIASIFRPYHAAISAALDRRTAAGLGTVLVSLHSFTPVMSGVRRPWRMGVLHQDDSRFSAAMLDLLRGELGDEAGDNEPYRMDQIDHTVPFHRAGREIDYLEIEVRQDLLESAEGQERIATLLARLLPQALAIAG